MCVCMCMRACVRVCQVCQKAQVSHPVHMVLVSRSHLESQQGPKENKKYVAH